MVVRQEAGSSRLLREINEAVALRHLLDSGPLTRGGLRELTGLAKPTTSDVMRRLQLAGLATAVGRTSGGPGPNAEVYAVNPDAAFGAVTSLRAKDGTLVTAACDLTGEVRARGETSVDAADPVTAVADAVSAACRRARIPRRKLDHVQLAVPGSYHEAAGVIRYVDVPGWSRPGLVGDIEARLSTTVSVGNDVNLAAVAERSHGIAADAESFALLWLGEEGLGLATDLGGTLVRGNRGGAGEIGYLPVGLPEPGGRPVPDMQELVGGTAIRALAQRHGIAADSAAGAVAAAVAAGADEFLTALAMRVAVGLAAVVAVLEPALVVLAGEVGQAGGATLADAAAAALRELSVLETTVAPTGLTEDAVLLGGLGATLAAVRSALLTRPKEAR